MSDAVVDDIVTVLPSLLDTLEALTFVARHLHPPSFGAVMEAAGTPDEQLRAVRNSLREWPTEYLGVRGALDRACEEALGAFDGLRAVQAGAGDLSDLFRALRHLPRAQEALYPLSARLPPVSRYFLNAEARESAELEAQLARPTEAKAGISHHHDEPGSRGGYALYVPEYYTPDRAWPLVMALHGGSGTGRGFLWSWLSDARSHGAILVAPTAIGPTWALMGDDADSPNLIRILDAVSRDWNVDRTRLLLTGMSDGGTFCYVSGLDAASPFTHLAPVSATFHPLMAEMADRDRLKQLPVFITHGRLDWMFPVQVARQTQQALAAAGAAVRYREIDDLSHCYPREINTVLLDWLARTTD